MKKKVLLFGYSRTNLGDDLFIYILAKRYTEVDFYIHIKEEKYKKPFQNLSNVNCLDTNRDVDVINIEDFDAFIYVGGSIFMESEYSKGEVLEFTKLATKCKEYKKPLFYMTCNFGPYYTEEYVQNARNLFELCEGVCLRDKVSYNLFSNVKSVSYAPDVVLTYDFSNITKRKSFRNVGISVIDLEIRDKLKSKEPIYNDYIKRIIIKFAKRGYKVNLISFCAEENDEKAIEKIINLLPEKYQRSVQTIKYTGDIEEFIKQYSKMKYMVCTRFHSMILSILMGQRVYNLAYSKKTNNTLEDLEIEYKIDNIDQIEYETRLSMKDFKRADKNKVKEIKKEAENQFQAFEQWLTNN